MGKSVLYTIEKGHHVSAPSRLWLHAGGYPYRRSWAVTFGGDCAYDFDTSDQADINKLVGFSLWNHVRTAFRVGWRWNRHECLVELLPYITVGGVDNRMTAPVVARVPLGKEIMVGIHLHEQDVTVQADGWLHTTGIPKRSWPRFGYGLRPYFGGNRTAPHTMHVSIKSL